MKKILPRTLFGRSLLILVLPILLIQVLTTYIFFDRHWNKMTDRLAYAVAGEIATIGQSIDGGADPEQFGRIARYATNNLGLLIRFRPGAVAGVAETDIHGETVLAMELLDALENQQVDARSISVDVEEKWVDVTIQLKTGVLEVSIPQRRLFSSSGYVFLLWMTMISSLLLAVAVLFMRNQIRPIRRLAVVAERIGRGLDIPVSFKPEGAREVRQATRAFLDMHARIKRQLQQRTAMLAGVSHDLRTPLTRMKLQIAMLGHTQDAADLRKDVEDMERMINAYLDFTRGEGGEQSARTDIGEMLERIAARARRQGVEVNVATSGDLSVPLRPVAFERCLANLVGNATKFGTVIWMTATRDEDEIRIEIEDNGPGIPDAMLEDVFKPFFRVEPSRNQKTGGVGLGLAIAQDIVTSHGGRIWLERSLYGGLKASIALAA